MNATARTTLQGLIWPEAGLNTERDLYVRVEDGATWSMPGREVHFIPGALADFGTYFNLFNSGKWHSHCDLQSLSLGLSGDGEFELSVFHAAPDATPARILTQIVSLSTAPAEFDIRPKGGFESPGVIYFQLRALSKGRLSDAAWQTCDTARRTPDLMLSITTFRRETAVTRTIERFRAFVDETALKDHLHLTVVDNGQSVEIPESPHVTVLPNANLGGSGGFARGLLVARERGASHCLFMDDDAAVHMQAIERTWVFLAYATDDATAVAGAVASARQRDTLWENGALFHRVCQPIHIGMDLTDLDAVLNMEFDSTAPVPHNFYGGWWYFAFPVEHARHMPFPFFVRGDDVSFSLVHDFNTVTLPGVMSFQDEDFSVKETPLTVYLDLRSHMAHHLSLPRMEIGRLGMMKIIARFYLRSLLFCHYETLDAIALALRDVNAGPSYFERNPDVSARRAEIAALTDQERWRPVAETRQGRPRQRISPHSWLPRLAMKITLNGHLLPGFRLIGNRVTFTAAMRGQVRPVWGAAEIAYVTADGKRSYVVRHSKARAWKATWPTLRATWRLWWSYPRVRDDWREGYERMTQAAFWRDQLKIGTDRSED